MKSESNRYPDYGGYNSFLEWQDWDAGKISKLAQEKTTYTLVDTITVRQIGGAAGLLFFILIHIILALSHTAIQSAGIVDFTIFDVNYSFDEILKVKEQQAANEEDPDSDNFDEDSDHKVHYRLRFLTSNSSSFVTGFFEPSDADYIKLKKAIQEKIPAKVEFN